MTVRHTLYMTSVNGGAITCMSSGAAYHQQALSLCLAHRQSFDVKTDHATPAVSASKIVLHVCLEISVVAGVFLVTHKVHLTCCQVSVAQAEAPLCSV